MTLRELAREVFDGFVENKLLIQASGIAFRAALAVIPLTLFALGLMGFLGLSEIWTADLAPSLKATASPAAFKVVDDTVTQVLGQGQAFWLTAGFVLTVWEVASAVRAIMVALNSVYDTDEDRPFATQVLVSVLLGLASVVSILAAVAAAQGIPSLFGEGTPGAIAGFVLGWLVALGLLGLAVGLVLRAGPDKSRPAGWVGFGAVLVVVIWVVSSLLFGLYMTNFAAPDTVFGALATGFVALEYLFLSSVALLAGVQVDAAVRDQLEKKEG
jgi:membrane protein